jgi:hypothetical protein
MRYATYSHRHALTLFTCEQPYQSLWSEISLALESISDDELVDCYCMKYATSMSISAAVNELIRERLVPLGWSIESPIFADPKYNARQETRWRLDFAKDQVSVEVAFNHGEASAWNLLKPVLASELNHVKKAIQTSAGVLITATEAMKAAGAFDGAVGTYESYVRYLQPLNNVLTVPILLVGLEAPETFRIEKVKTGNKNIGHVVLLSPAATLEP